MAKRGTYMSIASHIRQSIKSQSPHSLLMLLQTPISTFLIWHFHSYCKTLLCFPEQNYLQQVAFYLVSLEVFWKNWYLQTNPYNINQNSCKNRTPSFGGGQGSAEVITDLIITTKLKKVLKKLRMKESSRVAEKKTRPETKKELEKYFNPGINNRICRKN